MPAAKFLDANSVPATKMLDAALGERKSMPAGILVAQKSMGFPNTRTETPVDFKCAAADNPWARANHNNFAVVTI
jgi:hypothetical protein